MNDIRPFLDRAALLLARIGGKIVGRPSDALLTALASQDRKGSGTTKPTQPPLVTASHHIQQGQSAFANGAYGEALHHFGVAIEYAPDAAWAWHGRGDALQLSGQYDAALHAYEQAISLDETCGLHHAGRANSLLSIGRITDAEAAWESALERDPSLTWMREGSKKT